MQTPIRVEIRRFQADENSKCAPESARQPSYVSISDRFKQKRFELSFRVGRNSVLFELSLVFVKIRLTSSNFVEICFVLPLHSTVVLVRAKVWSLFRLLGTRWHCPAHVQNCDWAWSS